MTDLIEPKAHPLKLADGSGVKTFHLSKFPAVAGREIVALYPLSNMPKIGEYETSQKTMLKLMAFVGVEVSPGEIVRLQTEALINNHCAACGGWEALARLEWAQLEYNCSFFARGLNSDFFANIRAKAPQWISPMLTALSEQLSQAAKQPSTN